MSKTYDMEIAGCKRSLPICPIDEKLDIAGFVMFSDVEITERTAAELLKKCPAHDVTSRQSPRASPWPMRWPALAAAIMWWPARA